MPRPLNHLRLLLFTLLVAVGAVASAETKIRVVASNVTTGNFQRYEEPGTRLLQAINGDIILMNEFNVEGNLSQWVASTFGEEFEYYIEPTAPGINIPNGIVTRFPILDSGTFPDPDMPDRNFPWVRLDIPGDSDLWAISVHLKASGSSADANRRNLQSTTIINQLIPSLNIPEGDHIVLGGDFNAQNYNEQFLNTLRQTFTIEPPYPADQFGDTTTNAPRNRPLDWVVATQDFHELEVPLIIGPFTFPNGMVFDTRLYNQAILDAFFSPAQQGDSGVDGMQHMLVARDFLLPAPPADFGGWMIE
ncbi:MAG: endonuclease/exonuclease/phosphatase family protein [Candidatus Sumerlaeia bacterium]|nr:endonuclease/exonuclease/phosphatase family protein [Candidatus Sumerlaeia bacterium]